MKKDVKELHSEELNSDYATFIMIKIVVIAEIPYDVLSTMALSSTLASSHDTLEEVKFILR